MILLVVRQRGEHGKSSPLELTKLEGMILNLFSATLVASLTAKTPADVKEMVDNIRQP